MDAVNEMGKTIQDRGYYPYVTNPDEVAEISNTPGRSDDLFLVQVIKTLERWLEYADDKLAGTGISCYVCPGNDDVFEIDEVIASSKTVKHAEGKVVQLDEHHEMVSSGWSNPTPWDTHREEPDEDLEIRIEGIIAQAKDPGNAVFNLHPPPVWQWFG